MFKAPTVFCLSQADVQLIIEEYKVPNCHFNSMVVPGTRVPRVTSDKPFDDNQGVVALKKDPSINKLICC